ncbi:endoribonuclease YBEY [Salix suchowensis]|nr:endoribonuclease YBEY [Salix suchowensis]
MDLELSVVAFALKKASVMTLKYCIAELLRLNVAMAMKFAFAISDFGGFDSIKLSVMLCNDEFTRNSTRNGSYNTCLAPSNCILLHENSLRFYKPKFRYIFCDMDGEKSSNLLTNANALKEAFSLTTNKGIIYTAYDFAVFDIYVYGRQGREILRSNLDLSVCGEAYLYSWLNEVPLIAFSNDHFLTLFEHPLVDSLHTAEIMPSVEHLLSAADMQVFSQIWSEFHSKMPELASLGTALGNGSEKTKAVADVIGASNDEMSLKLSSCTHSEVYSQLYENKCAICQILTRFIVLYMDERWASQEKIETCHHLSMAL